jgi:hypothetical protein
VHDLQAGLISEPNSAVDSEKLDSKPDLISACHAEIASENEQGRTVNQ